MKQVIIIRKDLNMRKGKMISQGAHASLKIFLDRLGALHELPTGEYTGLLSLTKEMKAWMEDNYKKITLSVNSEAELESIYKQAMEAGIPAALIVDSGLTEFAGVPTKTAVAIGPDEDEKIDLITGKLSLL